MKKLRRPIRWTVFLVAFLAAWCVAGRLTSSWRAVRLIARPAATGEGEDSGPRGTLLRVGCYNIAHARGNRRGASNWDGGGSRTRTERLRRVARVLREADLDIVVLNEVDFSSVWSGHVNQAELIAEEAGYPYRAEQRNVDVGIPFCRLRFGNAVLSRHPITRVERVDFPAHSRFEDIVAGSQDGVLCRVRLPDGEEVRVLGVHLDYRNATARVEAARIIIGLERRCDVPLIAAGDFNSTPPGFPGARADPSGANALSLLLEEAGFRTLPTSAPLPEDFTFPTRSPRKVIDWILVSPPWELRARSVLRPALSDHLAVVAVLAPRGFPPPEDGSSTNARVPSSRSLSP